MIGEHNLIDRGAVTTDARERQHIHSAGEACQSLCPSTNTK